MIGNPICQDIVDVKAHIQYWLITLLNSQKDVFSISSLPLFFVRFNSFAELFLIHNEYYKIKAHINNFSVHNEEIKLLAQDPTLRIQTYFLYSHYFFLNPQKHFPRSWFFFFTCTTSLFYLLSHKHTVLKSEERDLCRSIHFLVSLWGNEFLYLILMESRDNAT